MKKLLLLLLISGGMYAGQPQIAQEGSTISVSDLTSRKVVIKRHIFNLLPPNDTPAYDTVVGYVDWQDDPAGYYAIRDEQGELIVSIPASDAVQLFPNDSDGV